MDLDLKQLAIVMKGLASEKNIPIEKVQEIVETALASAYRKDYGERGEDYRVHLDMNTGDMEVSQIWNVVEEVTNEHSELSLEDATTRKKDATIGDVVEKKLEVKDFGRVAAQTAKGVIIQRLREAEKEVIATEYQDKVGEVLNGVVSRIERGVVRVDIGKATAIMPMSEQSQGEHYRIGERTRVYLKEIQREEGRAPQVIVSRSDPNFVIRLFEFEVPEIEEKGVEIKGIAREAGQRTKLAVTSNVPGVDPVGTFVGGRGTRINSVLSEIGDREKVDIVLWNADPVKYIETALSPTKISNIVIDNNTKIAKVIVPEDQLSIAIGRGGQNVRLASKLTGYEIGLEKEEVKSLDETVKTKLKKKSDLENSLLSAIDEQ